MWMAAGVTVVLVLSGVALYYQVLLQKKNRQTRRNEEGLKAELAERKAKNKKSIMILARAVLEEQVTLTEASIRINALLPTLGLDTERKDELSVFRQVAEATAHIPILDQWKALSRREKQSFEKEIEVIEANFRDFTVAAAEKIVRKDLLQG